MSTVLFVKWLIGLKITVLRYIADRGYASYNDFAHVLEKQQYFLIRCTDVKTSRLLGFPLEDVREIDCHVDRILCRSKAKKNLKHPELLENYRYVCKEVPMDFKSADGEVMLWPKKAAGAYR